MLPQKRNPDVAELVRGRAGTVLGRLAGFLATLKGLPLAYARDLQEDKAAAFEATDLLVASMNALAGLVAGLEPDKETMRGDAEAAETTAVDLAEALVREGVPFREAHSAVGAAVRLAATRGARLADLPAEDLAAVHPALAAADRSVLGVDGSLTAKATPGSTNPTRVGDQLTVLEVAASAARTWSTGFRPTLDLGLD
jgi:argininosuccinate lyase